MWQRFSETEKGAILWNEWIMAIVHTEFSGALEYANLIDRVKASDFGAEVREMLVALIERIQSDANEIN